MKSFNLDLLVFSLAAHLALSLTVSGAWASEKRFPSEVPGIGMSNAAIISERSSLGELIRGAAPDSDQDYKELRQYGVNKVLIFKKATSQGQVKREIPILRRNNMEYLHIPYKWEDLDSFEETCDMTVDALNYMLDAEKTRGAKLYLHCTYGEDRTGVLAGLYRMLRQDWGKQKAFNEEMCLYGYEAGNPRKPEQVNQKIRRGLTHFFLQMARLIEDGELTQADLKKPKLCRSLASQVRSEKWWRYQCRRSDRFVDDSGDEDF